MQSLRLWGRAADVLQRSKPTTPNEQASRSPSPNPFQVTQLKEAISDITGGVDTASKSEQPQLPSHWLSFHRGPSLDGSDWRIAVGLLTGIFSAAKYFLSRGSVKAAQRYIIDAEALAASLESPGMHARALARKAELFLRTGSYEEAYTSIAKAAELLATVRTHCCMLKFYLNLLRFLGQIMLKWTVFEGNTMSSANGLTMQMICSVKQ
jgi:hypothetical protein